MCFTYSRQPFLVDQLQELNNMLENNVRLQYKLKIILYILQIIMVNLGCDRDIKCKINSLELNDVFLKTVPKAHSKATVDNFEEGSESLNKLKALHENIHWLHSELSLKQINFLQELHALIALDETKLKST